MGRKYEIIDDNGVIYSGRSPGKLSNIFNRMRSGEDTAVTKGDVKLVRVLDLY